MKSDHVSKITSGSCLCGQVQFEIHDDLRGIVNCHCSKCRKFHGNFGAYLRIEYENLHITEEKGLKWYKSSADETPNVFRGFCSECGSSLFWHPKGEKNIAISAGSLDTSTNLKIIGHIWYSQKPDYYEIDDDLPIFNERWET